MKPPDRVFGAVEEGRIRHERWIARIVIILCLMTALAATASVENLGVGVAAGIASIALTTGAYYAWVIRLSRPRPCRPGYAGCMPCSSWGSSP